MSDIAGTYSIFQMAKQPEQFPQLPILAERLGVKPAEGGSGRTLLCMNNGDRYDLFELINAFLDRLERQS